ncbi:MAG TPA: photosynthetic reaction center cytochrome c subunit family protein [Bryobacteraceae bacterium]|jgi:hypothetical protein
MQFWSKRLPVAVAVISLGCLAAAVLATRAAAQAPPSAAKSPKSGAFFKNVTTSTLKELTPDDFLSAMGVMTDSLGWDCSECHPGAGTDKADWVFDTPRKKTARKMVEMVYEINKTNFAGAQLVTCYTCHHARDTPATTVSLDALYSTPNQEKDDIVKAQQGAPAASAVLDKYIAAIGGTQKVNAITSYITSGKSLGFAGLGGNGEFTIYAKSPDQRTTQIVFKDHPERGQSTWAFNGKTGWIVTPRGFLDEYELSGANIDGARIEAQLSFPGQIKASLTNWRSGGVDTIGDQDYQILQGSGPKGLLVTLYFDTESGLLKRMIRYTNSPIGRVPTQIDYADYRDVNGVKFPFEISFLWLDGRWTAKLESVKTNVAIEAAKFGKP